MADVKHWLYGAIGFLLLQKLVLAHEACFGLLHSHADLLEHMWITVSCRLIHSLEVAIKKKCSYAKFFQGNY